ncbi:Alpha/beta hydrolase fold-3 [Penicillium alfredii]|uniref:Alpha/beta hydrolase fold-3 n=1 Tax=Penicillium alfredii TaxID=1506179 RepID=A0A9W9EHF6_9EURO|nr:Alpha/beta hydrolase fold-3 [Penicillium alfredii]KAJ5081834.1 Alpha/beta hydrolase fold-3 [Penicillium alfredii]
MLRYGLCWLGWALAALAQFQSFSPPGHNEITYSINIPQKTADSGSGPIYFQLNSTRSVEWFALGQGRQMRGANIFVVYTAGDNVTVSPRLGKGHVEPLYNKDARVTVLNSSGVHDGVITANVRCDSCITWNGGNEDVTSSSSSWLWAVKYGRPLNSNSESADIVRHDDMGVSFFDLKQATGGSSANPFLDLQSQTSDASAGPGFDLNTFKRKKTAHAVLMILAFVVFFPVFALALRILPSSLALSLHAISQITTVALILVGFGLGISMADDIGRFNHYHPIIGIVVVGTLVLFQPAMGMLQHLHYRKTGEKGPFAYGHRWLGRIIIVLGIVNAGLGFKMVGIDTAEAPRGAVIAYGVVAGVIGVVYLVVIGLLSRNRRYLHRKSLHDKPTVHITYDEGIQIVRQFLFYASKHPVEDLQAFTRQSVPSPHWVRTEAVTIPAEHLSEAANVVSKQLGRDGIVRVGGEKWWQWRGPSEGLKGEWIEMRSHYNQNKKENQRSNRVMLYLHGGAYFFGSVDTHRYMMQRHARKLKGRVFAPDYRLAPQFPFPCGLHDCMAAYLWLLKTYQPNEIILAGDSAGGGMSLSMMEFPLPAGAILISPWVDLTHSFPSIVEDNPGDYIPPYGFRHKPSTAWPPPNADEILDIKKMSRKETVTTKDVEKAIPAPNSAEEETAVRGYTVHEKEVPTAQPAYPGQQQNPDPATVQTEPDNIHVVLDGKTVELKDQIQMYATNQLISHPLILGGGGERLRDEQFYVAHKAADPTAYPPSDVYLDQYDPDRGTLNKYGPTYVQLQVWDDLCHVAPTLSFTRPAKYMFRAISQFGSWALARAQSSEVEIVDESVVSPVSSSSSDDSGTVNPGSESKKSTEPTGTPSVGVAGDPLPPFYKHMLRQRVDKRGHVYQLDPPSAYPVLDIPPAKVGAINPELIRKWLAAKGEWDVKFAKEKLRVQSRRIEEMSHGFQDFEGECPPASSLAARRAAPGVLPPSHAKKNYGLMLWSGWGSKHDERTMEREREVQQSGRRSTRTSVDAGQAGSWSSKPSKDGRQDTFSSKDGESNGKSQSATDQHQSGTSTVTWDTASEMKQPAADLPGRTSVDPDSVSTRPVSEKSAGPILVLPEVDNRKLTDDSASTRALFHAAGTLPMKSDASLAHSRYRPESAAGSMAGRSEFMSDTASTVGGDKDSVAGFGTVPDVASTRAVIGATGVVGIVHPNDSGRISTDTLSVPGGRSSTSRRPDMPDRDVFKTAEEHL